MWPTIRRAPKYRQMGPLPGEPGPGVPSPAHTFVLPLRVVQRRQRYPYEQNHAEDKGVM